MSTTSYPQCWKSETKPPKFCPGCGHLMALRAFGQTVDTLKIQDQTILGVDIGCSLLAWDFFDLDTIQTHHGRTIPVMLGLKMAQPSKICIAYLGDGGGYAIGAQHLVNSSLRNDPITVILINNANYAMTGGQMAPTTLSSQITETTPYGKKGASLKGPELARNINADAFIARGLAAEIDKTQDLIAKAIQHQREKNGFSFVEILAPCPTNWRLAPTEIKSFMDKMRESFPIGEL
ncbi:2-oxoglutarate synthase [bacterium (Candidatus Torokbacteria) CG09_land_8_20_14_0_10_42_11]|nr:MAG: 2-oxoglutarate synthase [bacterium (Candidatus Torokbacteria) CG09_land_8_20_14_0_10_42_11]